MRILVLHAHPVDTSYGAALHRVVVETLTAAGHEVDDCDLYAENFNPVLSAEERAGYHSIPGNIEPVRAHVERLRWAEALVMVYPVWNFGFPAILKGYLDRVFLPDVTFRIRDGRVLGALDHIRKLVVVTTYGANRWRAFLIGDPPRKVVTRMIRHTLRPLTPVRYLAHYDMNRATDATRAAFLARVKAEMAAI